MGVARVDTLQLGELVFRDLPVLVYDPQAYASDTAACLLDGGVIGSDVMPGNVWQFDLDAGALHVADSADALDIPAATPTAPLHLFGFPFAPIIDWSVGDKFTDKALFDTGSPATVAVFARAYEALRQQRLVRSTGVLRGHEGEAAGGLGPEISRQLLDVPQLRVGGATLADVSAVSRPQAPTLFGAGLLATHIVTLDYVQRRILIHPRATPEAPPSSDFACRWTQDGVRVLNVRVSSPAWRKGLRPGQRVLQANERLLEPTDPANPCELVAWVIDTLPQLHPLTLYVKEGGKTKTIELD